MPTATPTQNGASERMMTGTRQKIQGQRKECFSSQCRAPIIIANTVLSCALWNVRVQCKAERTMR